MSEQFTEVENALLLDVDGVITHLSEKRNTESQIFDILLKKLEKGEPIALNTGRSLPWVTERVIGPMIENVRDKSSLANLLVIGEMGGVWVTFDENGEVENHIDSGMSAPKTLQDKIRHLVETRYKDSMFFDETKETMITVEMNDGQSQQKFWQAQEKLARDIRSILKRLRTPTIKVILASIATDIMDSKAGKGLGAKKFLGWLKEKGIRVQNFIAIGDSEPDIEMAREISSQGEKVEFIFVGERGSFAETDIPVHLTTAKSEKGTLEYLLKVA